MAADLDVDRDVFNGRIAVAFMVATTEIVDRRSDSHEPYYLLAPRTGYLSLIANKIRRHFHLPAAETESSDEAQANEMWFEYRGRILKWNHPIGVLYDCFGTNEGLPWEVTVHIKNYPRERLMRSLGNAVETHFINQVKQACHIKHGTTQVDGLQSEHDKKELWSGVQNVQRDILTLISPAAYLEDNFEHFRRVNEKLMQCKDGSWFKLVPFLLYICTAEVQSNPDLDVEVRQRKVALTSAEGIPRTLGDLLEDVVDGMSWTRVIMHGTEPPLETPLQWLCEHFAHPDNFLHVILHT